MKELKKTYYWTSNDYDTVYTLKVCHGSKVVTSIRGLNASDLRAAVAELKANGYEHK
jgi:hypothetical protein